MMLNTMKRTAGTWTKVAVSAAVLSCSAIAANAATFTTLDQAANIFTSGSVTGGAPFTVDAAGQTPITSAVELPGFAFGTYDVDIAADSIKMTFVNDPAALGIANYDASTVDQYFFEFDRQVAAADIIQMTTGFAATVDILAAGSTASSIGSFVPGLSTDFTFANGGILVSIAEGTDLFAVGTGGSLTIAVAAVPLPASLPLALVGLGGLGLMRSRSRKAS